MRKVLFAAAVALLAAGCSTVQVNLHHQHANHAPAASSCGDGCHRPVYEVSIDAWCGAGCGGYPVTSRTRPTDCDDTRVEMRGIYHGSSCKPR